MDEKYISYMVCLLIFILLSEFGHCKCIQALVVAAADAAPVVVIVVAVVKT
jgi:hypothetical protein